MDLSIFKAPLPVPPKTKYVNKDAKKLKEPMPFPNKHITDFFRYPKSNDNVNDNLQSHLVITDEGPMPSDTPHFMLAQKEGNVHYSADVNNELHGRLVLSESTTPEDNYRYVPFELPETDSESVDAAAGPEVDGTVPLGDSDAVLTGHTSTCAISTAPEPPDDTVSSTNGLSQPQQAESNSGNAAGASAGHSAAEVTIPSAKSALYHSKNFKDPPEYIAKVFGTSKKQYRLRDIFNSTNL